MLFCCWLLRWRSGTNYGDLRQQEQTKKHTGAACMVYSTKCSTEQKTTAHTTQAPDASWFQGKRNRWPRHGQPDMHSGHIYHYTIVCTACTAACVRLLFEMCEKYLSVNRTM